jgi:Ca-activated chloride channel family protein
MEWHLMRPEWLWGLLPALILGILLWRQRGRSGSWSEVIDAELLPLLVGSQAAPRRTNLLPLVLLGWVLAVVAASGPSINRIAQPVLQKQDALVIILDLSYSMKSGDLAPSRLDRSRQKLLDLLGQRKEGQTGLIAYAGDAHIVTPLTDDTRTIANLLPALNPDMMPVPGSDPVAAVEQAVALLHSAGISQGRILLLTDDIPEKHHKNILRALSGSGASLSVMGVGTSTGAPIPLPRGGFLKDESGAIVMPGLEERSLSQFAVTAGGRYMSIQVDASDLDYLLAENLTATAAQTLVLDRSADTWEDQGYILIALLLPLALALFRRGWILCLAPLLLFSHPQTARADLWQDLWLTPDQQGQRALLQGDPESASELFDNPDWAGTAAYQGEDYERAREMFSASDTAAAWYNRGNALARSGDLEEAIAAYRESLDRLPDQSDALENIALLEQLQQQQQQQQQQQSNEENEQEQQQEQQEQEQQSGQEPQDQQDQQQQDSPSAGDARDEQQQTPPGGDEQPDQEQREDAEQSDPGEQQQPQQQDAQGEPEQAEQESAEEQQAQMAAADPEQQEKDQAMEQWLRRIPDDPSGLLREKFRYESQQRQQQGARRDDETYW